MRCRVFPERVFLFLILSPLSPLSPPPCLFRLRSGHSRACLSRFGLFSTGKGKIFANIRSFCLYFCTLRPGGQGIHKRKKRTTSRHDCCRTPPAGPRTVDGQFCGLGIGRSSHETLLDGSCLEDRPDTGRLSGRHAGYRMDRRGTFQKPDRKSRPLDRLRPVGISRWENDLGKPAGRPCVQRHLLLSESPGRLTPGAPAPPCASPWPPASTP